MLRRGGLRSRPLPEGATLVRELTTFQVKITPATNEVFAAWREGQHDDLGLAVAIAVWQAEHFLEAWVLLGANCGRLKIWSASRPAWARRMKCSRKRPPPKAELR
jgi:hypothetical protein